jgi:hypothetical protein
MKTGAVGFCSTINTHHSTIAKACEEVNEFLTSSRQFIES